MGTEQSLETKRIDHLGIVAGICHEIGLIKAIDKAVGPSERKISCGVAVQAMVLNGLGSTSRELYLMPQYLDNKPVDLLVVNQFPDDSPHLYTARKVITYLVNILATLFIFGIWVQHVGDLSVALGILGAGLAFALQEVIGSIAGWVTIITGQPFTIGDRVETGGIRGDVVDIGVLRAKMMEIANWLGGDHNTGRIVTESNAYIFKEPLFNYSRHLHYIWDEVTIPITYESDWRMAISIMVEAIRENLSYQDLLPKVQEQRRLARREFAIKITPLEPRVFVRLTDNWIELGLIYPVDTDMRRTVRDEIGQRILNEFATVDITIASETIAIVQIPSAGQQDISRP